MLNYSSFFSSLPGAILSVAVGTLVTVIMLGLCRKSVPQDDLIASVPQESVPIAQPIMQSSAKPQSAAIEAIDTSDDLDIHIEFE